MNLIQFLRICRIFFATLVSCFLALLVFYRFIALLNSLWGNSIPFTFKRQKQTLSFVTFKIDFLPTGKTQRDFFFHFIRCKLRVLFCLFPTSHYIATRHWTLFCLISLDPSISISISQLVSFSGEEQPIWWTRAVLTLLNSTSISNKLFYEEAWRWTYNQSHFKGKYSFSIENLEFICRLHRFSSWVRHW